MSFGSALKIAILALVVLNVTCDVEPANHNVSHDNNTSDNEHTDGHEKHHGIEVASLHFHSVRAPLLFTIVILLAGLSKVGFHYADFLSSKLPESCLLILIGTVMGAILTLSGAVKYIPAFFSPHTFFQYLLPPIILEASFSLHDRTFADNIGSVLLFAVVGTIIACFTLGLTLYGLAISGGMGVLPFEFTLVQVLIFTALIVAVDPVAVLAVFQEVGVNDCLYFLVFGESLLNDGVTVVLYQVFQTYNDLPTIGADQIVLGIVKFFVVCFGGLFLGVLAGVMTAVITKFTVHVKVVQPLVIYSMAYLGFLLAELFEFSGIISIIGCGLVQVQYAFHNISDKSKTTVKYFTKVISTTMEIVIFLFLGLALIREHYWHTGFVLWTILFCFVYRFIITFFLSFLINKLDKFRVRKIGYDEQFMIAYGGLRGAVCFSLVMLLDEASLPPNMKNMFVTTTLIVIMFTVFVQGITMKPLVEVFKVKLAPEKQLSMYRELSNHIIDHLMAGMEDIIGFNGKYSFKEKLENFDSRYIRPCLQIEPQRSDSELKAFYNKIVLKEHFKYLRMCGVKSMPGEANIPHIDTSMYLPGIGQKPVIGEEDDDANQMPVEIEPEPAVRRRHKSKDQDVDAKSLRHLLLSHHTSRMMLHSNYDKNLTEEYRSSMANQIQKKTARNRRLQRLKSSTSPSSPSSPVSDRPASWSDFKAQACEERKEKDDHAHPRAVTIDLGNTARMGMVEPDLPREEPSLDAVFEEEETDHAGKETETKPLLRREHTVGGIGPKSAPPRPAPGMERQLAMDEIPLKELNSKDDPMV
ncbi:sodium/hydrogen exchanger 1-like isoform X1 [Haliotis rufescens]|uniref:sodium/hydrogen exchanger 1-like isoform X1 n=1 Tax=Haliotis rufescens TaxID=6454 RepID=UPI001EB053C0|nr:sodium/hydrogen exchanger 1-like isoform X1 [Haliotis rufescens]